MGELLILNQHARHENLVAWEEDIAVNFIILPQFFETTLGMMGSEESSLPNATITIPRGGRLCRMATPTTSASDTGNFAASFPGSVVPYLTCTELGAVEFDVGYGGGTMVWPWFRTYRVNTDATVTQVD